MQAVLAFEAHTREQKRNQYTKEKTVFQNHKGSPYK